MIYFVCPDLNVPSGGIKVIYRFVEMLNKNGLNAVVLHKNNKADGWVGRPTWFEYSEILVPILYSYIDGKPNAISINENDDWFIVPEGYGRDIIYKFKNLKCGNKVVFAQSWSYIIPSFGYSQQDQVIKNWRDAGFNKVLVTSDIIAEVVKSLFKYADNQVGKVSPFVEPEFNDELKFGEFSKNIDFYDKETVILFNPRKHPQKYNEVFAYLSHMNPTFFNKWRLMPIDNKNQTEMVDALKRYAIFLNCSHEEGFGLPLLEAFGTNTIAVGHTGLGASEFFKTEFADDTNSSFKTAKKLYEAMSMFDDNDENKWNDIVERQKNIFKLYNREQTEQQLIQFFKG